MMTHLVEAFFKFLLILIFGVFVLCTAVQLVSSVLGVILPWLGVALLLAAAVAGLATAIALTRRAPCRNPGSPPPTQGSLTGFRVRRPKGRTSW